MRRLDWANHYVQQRVASPKPRVNRPRRTSGANTLGCLLVATSHEPGTPHYPEEPDLIEARLIEEIINIRAQLGLDMLGPRSVQALRAAATEALGKQADQYENLAHLYRQLAVRRGPRPRGAADLWRGCTLTTPRPTREGDPPCGSTRRFSASNSDHHP